MFGYVRPLVGEMKVKEHQAYQAVYCGLCHAIGMGGCGEGGASARLALRYDTVFLALTRILISRDALTVSPKRCLLHPLKPRPTLAPCPSLSYSADAGALLFAHSIADHIRDEGGWTHLLAPYAAYLRTTFSARIATRTTAEHDRSPDALMKEKLDALHEMEQAGEESADRVADAFGVLLGEVFAYDLSEEGREHAYVIGYHIGRWIYFADALDDLDKDEKRDRYNPFRMIRAAGDWDPACIRSAMYLDLKAAHRALDAIEGGDAGCRAILHNMLALGMVQKTDELTALPNERIPHDK